MSRDKPNFDFDHIGVALKQLNALSDPAEAHGIICGYICAGADLESTDWLEPIIATDEHEECLAQTAGQQLSALYHHTFQQLQNFQFDLFLLLPDDNTSLQTRSEALGAWCQGLLTGLAMAAPTIRHSAESDLQDTLDDLTKITLIDYEHTQANEENESAYMEVVEYARMATLLIHSILNTPAASATGGEVPASDRIH